ncbi:MAG: ATP-binding protein [Vulcanisaeta sp.]
MATLDIDDEEIKELVDKLHSVEVAVEGTEIMVHFSDREQETAMFIKRVLGYPGIAAIYGPRGAGKTTLLKLLVERAKEVGGFENFVFIRYEFSEKILSDLQLGIPKLNEGVIGEIANELSKSLNNLTIGTTYLGITIALRDIITSIIKIIERYNLRDKKVVVIYDDIDKYVGKHDQDALMAAANAIADKIVHEYIPRRLWVKVIFAVSDNAASRELDRLGSKGGYTPYLLWNLPKRAFREVVDEVVMKTGVKDVDFDLLWNLLGGNVRELGMIITGYNWNMKAWLQDIAINRVKETFRRHAESSGFGSVEKALAWLIEKGRVAARDYGLGEFTGQPDAVEGVLGLLENNIMIDVSPPGVWHLSELPSEPWIGKDYAYQIPAYYWAIRAMVEAGKANVTPEDLLKIMQH